MKPYAIELDDRALAIARGGEVLSSEPSAVFDGSTGQPAGAPAWHALRLLPTATSTRHVAEIATRAAPSPGALSLMAAELRRRLAAHPPQEGERVWIAVPARIDAQGLGVLLALLRELPLPVDGFVDAAAATVAALGLDRTALVLELGLHHVGVTAVDTDSRARRRRALTSESGGLIELYESWLELISAAMVRRTRFDPLHDATTEQQLFDALPALAREAAREGSTVASVTIGGSRFETPLTRDQFTEAAQSVCREVLRLLHELRPAGAAVALVVPGIVGELPGLREAFESFVGCELIAIPDGFAAAAVSLLDLPQPQEEGVAHLLRRLPARARPELLERVMRTSLGGRRTAAPPPSHVLFDGRAYSLADGFVVGRAPGAAHAITLPEGLAGVSRRHCTFTRDGEELVLIDHSSFGTFVNGERVAGRVRVHAGDRVRLGEPGVELALIAVGEAVTGSHGEAQA